jgi:hypothetical protein
MIGVYSATGLRSLTATDTDTDNDFTGSGFTGIVSTTVSVLGGGFALSSATQRAGSASSVQWTGGTSDFLQAPGEFAGALSGAHNAPSGAQNITFTTQFDSGAGIGIIGSTASFR